MNDDYDISILNGTIIDQDVIFSSVSDIVA